MDLMSTEPSKTVLSEDKEWLHELNFIELIEKCKNHQVQRVKAFLQNPIIRDDLVRRAVRRQLTAERHNVFDALGLSFREIYHSRLLAYLLDPNGRHDQGPVFLRCFLEHIFKNVILHDANLADRGDDWWRQAKVTTEHGAEDAGRIDLIIRLPDGIMVAIENKIYAGEGENQIPRYSCWLKGQSNVADTVFVFLTPDGRPSQTAHSEDNVLLMSFKELADCLRTGIQLCPSTAEPLIATVQQYIQLCDRLAQGESSMTDFNKEILELMRDPKNLEIALDIETHLAKLKIEIQNKFRQSVVDQLNLRLAKQGEEITNIWTSGYLPGGYQNYYIGIFPKNYQKDSPTKNYSCLARLSFLSNGAEIACIGWFRPVWMSKKSRKDDIEIEVINLETSIVRNGDGVSDPNEGWWLTKRTFSGEPDLQSFASWNNDVISAIHNDNQGNHSLAIKLTNLLMEIFERYKIEIEKLPGFKASYSG